LQLQGLGGRKGLRAAAADVGVVQSAAPARERDDPGADGLGARVGGDRRAVALIYAGARIEESTARAAGQADGGGSLDGLAGRALSEDEGKGPAAGGAARQRQRATTLKVNQLFGRRDRGGARRNAGPAAAARAANVHLLGVAAHHRDAAAAREVDALVSPGDGYRTVHKGLVAGRLERAAAALDRQASRADVQLLVASSRQTGIVAGGQGTAAKTAANVHRLGGRHGLGTTAGQGGEVARARRPTDQLNVLSRNALRRAVYGLHQYPVARQRAATVQAEGAARAEILCAARAQEDRCFKGGQRNVAHRIEGLRARLGDDLDTRRRSSLKRDPRMLWAAESACIPNE